MLREGRGVLAAGNWRLCSVWRLQFIPDTGWIAHIPRAFIDDGLAKCLAGGRRLSRERP